VGRRAERAEGAERQGGSPNVILAEGIGRQPTSVLVQRPDRRRADWLLQRGIPVVDPDELQVAPVGQPRDPVERPASDVATAAGGREADGALEIPSGGVGIGAGDDEMVDAPDHGADASSIR